MGNTNKMDWLDRLSIWMIVVLVITSSALISHHMGEAGSEKGHDRNSRQTELSVNIIAANSEIAGRIKAIKGMMDSNPANAEQLARELSAQYPYEGEFHMLMGDILSRKQKSLDAVSEYKKAIDLNPDYLDKKTVLFQGRKLKVAVNEALMDIERKLSASPDDEKLRKTRKDIYYLQRKIAGSCA